MGEYGLSMPVKEEMINYIKHELKYHDSQKIVLSMRHKRINIKSLRDELRNKTHGDIVTILTKMERMFKFKIMCSLHKKGSNVHVKKLDFSTKKATKSLPEWWSTNWDYCMVEGTLKFGWGNVPSQFVREHYEFTPTYKGVKRAKKKKNLNKKRLRLQHSKHCHLICKMYKLSNHKIIQNKKQSQCLLLKKECGFLRERSRNQY